MKRSVPLPRKSRLFQGFIISRWPSENRRQNQQQPCSNVPQPTVSLSFPRKGKLSLKKSDCFFPVFLRNSETKDDYLMKEPLSMKALTLLCKEMQAIISRVFSFGVCNLQTRSNPRGLLCRGDGSFIGVEQGSGLQALRQQLVRIFWNQPVSLATFQLKASPKASP